MQKHALHKKLSSSFHYRWIPLQSIAHVPFVSHYFIIALLQDVKTGFLWPTNLKNVSGKKNVLTKTRDLLKTFNILPFVLLPIKILKEVLYFVHIVHNISTALQSGFCDKKEICRSWCVLENHHS